MKLSRKILNAAFCTVIAFGSGCGDKIRHKNISLTPNENTENTQEINQKNTPTTPSNSTQTSTQNTQTNNSTPTAPTQTYVVLDDSNNQLRLNDYIGSVRPILTEQDTGLLESFVIQSNGVPTIAHQSLDLSNSRLMPVYGQNESDVFGFYLFCRTDDEMFTYKINFDNGLASSIDADGSLENIVGSELKILGNNWKIFKAGFNFRMPSLYWLEMTLLGDGLIDNLQMGEHRTYTLIGGKTYDLTVNLLTPQDAVLTVNGQVTGTIVPGQLYTLVDGAQVGIRKINWNQAEIWLSTEKIELTDTDTTDNDYTIAGLQIDNDVIQRGQVKISAIQQSNAARIYGIEIKVCAGALVGDVYVPEQGELSAELSQPQSMLSNKWDIQYVGERADGSHEVRVVEK